MMILNEKKDYTIYIGRFQPFHQGHLACVREGLAIAQEVIIIVGSVNQTRTRKNPWDYKQRRRMIRAALSPEQNKQTRIAGVRDFNDDRQWQRAVEKTVNRLTHTGTKSIVLLGYTRDESSGYLSQFPNWDYIEVPEFQSINATKIRSHIMAHGDIQSVTRPVADQIRHFLESNTFKALVNNTSTDKTCPKISGRTLDAT